MERSNIITKVNAILAAIKNGGLQYHNFNNFRWIPAASESPRGYPQCMSWKGANNTSQFTSHAPTQIYLQTHQYAIGSVHYVVHPEVSANFQSCFGNTPHITKVLFQDVLANLKNLDYAFNIDEKATFQNMVMKIYQYLAVNFSAQLIQWIQIRKEFSIWHGSGFVPIGKIFLSKDKEQVSDVSPYFFQPPNDVLSILGNVLSYMDCQKSAFNIYVNTLKAIAAKYAKTNTKKKCNVVKDTNLALSLVKEIANRFSTEANENRADIFVPLDSESLKLAPLETCHYLDFSSDTRFSISSNILNRHLGTSVARQLNVPNLASKVLQGNQESIFEPWGQKQEPLTKNLKRILDDYQDGLAIIKELVQNADDAGASEVSILYDRRTNDNLKTHLISPAMKDWQGPALWVHNDKMFTEEDFINITRLNAGTKKSEATKIGKFGLGFNAVYHLTDVPSIMSGKSLIFFDPHLKYLGDAVRSREPGIRISLDKNADLKIYGDQFAVYEKIFGAQVDLNSNSPSQEYKGSLFRFPLRNANCTRTSEINPLHYSDQEMRTLLNKVKDSLQTLILFTQNVSSFSVYELNDQAKSPTEMKLLFSTSKSKDHGIRDMVQYANKELERRDYQWYGFNQNQVTTPIKLMVKKDTKETTHQWVVQSRNGGADTYTFAMSHPNEGYLPYCSVAVCLGNKNDVIQQKGHLFCFLPLPIKNGLPSHVNAAFELSSNRLSLKAHNEDEKIYHTAQNWNDLIAKDAGNAYYSLLLHLVNKVGISGQDFYNLFPGKDRLEIQNFTKIILTTFLQNCFGQNDAVFPFSDDSSDEDNTWMQWKNLNFPGSSIPEQIQSISLNFLNWQSKKNQRQNRAVRLPPWFKNLIQKLGFDDQIKSKEVSFQQLLQLFSENVEDRGLPKEIREGIINYLLSKSILHRTSMIGKRCIPTKPNGRLRRTNQLIQEGSDVSILYDVTDERFPDLKDNDVIKYLQTHGMEAGGLSWTKILDRAQTVEQSANKERGSALLRIISKKLERKDFPATQSDVEACNQLKGTKFLPVMKKPKKCLFNKWHGSTAKVSSPKEIYPHSFSNTLSCSNYICSEKMDDSVVKLFQIKVTPRQEDLATQLNEFLPKFKTTDFKYRDALKEITILYSEAEVKEETRLFLSQAKFIMADNGQLYSADTMFLQVDHIITGKLHSIHGSYKDMKESERVQELFFNVGVKPKATATDYATALKGLWEEYNNNRLTKFHIDEIYHLLPVLADFEEKHLFIDDLYLPDQQNILRKTSELCYNDVTWLPNDPDVHYSNSEISHQHAIQLKIKSRRSDYILRGKHIDDTPWIDDSQVTTESFGQYDNLTARIKRLIENYSDPFDILKETIQNADDAESNEIEFILDKRSHGTEKVISEKWEHLQGPGLLIVNDGKFTTEDLQGIQKLGVGSHKNDPLKTGKYGVGFNTVYSLTDCPILLTKVDGTEDRMCMFDPHRKYAEGATDKRPGCSFPDARTFLDPYDDVKSAFLFNEEDKETKTILRLPFRMGDTAKDSEISTTSVSIKTIEKTMKGFLEHADEFLLFLNNIKTIKIRIVNGEGEKDELFSVHSKLYDTLPSTVDSFKVSAKGFADRFGDIYSMIDSEMQLHRKHCIRHLKDDKVQHATHWDVFEQVGFSSFDDLPDSVKDTLESQTHHLVPKGGIAKLSSKDDCVECDREKCSKNTSYTKLKSLFCTLPINLETGISGIINGNFFLDSDNRRALYNGEDKNKEWNQSILNHCVLPCFISHLEFVKKHIEGKFNLQKVERKPDPKSQQNEQPDDIFLEKCLRRISINNFLSLFPSTEESTDKYFKIFTKAFYMRITDKGNRLLPVHRPGDVKFWSPREFLLFEGKDSSCNLLNVMKMANLKVDVLPDPIIKDFSESGNKHDYSLTTATPTVVRELLNRENRLVFFKDGMEHSKSSLKTVENINTLLSFCLKKENDKRHSNPKNSKMDSDTPPKADEKAPSIDLTGLPLCLLQDRTLKSFNSKPAFLTKYSTLFNEEKSRFMHKSSFSTLSQEHIEHSCFKEFDLHQFKDMLQNSTFNDLLKDSKIGDKDCKVNEFKAWIKNCWELIESCFHEEKRKQKEEEKKRKREQKDESEEGKDKTKEVKVDYLENQLDIIKDVPLLLVKKGTKESLLPIENRKKILGPDHNNNKIYDFITKACGGFEVVTCYKQTKQDQDTYCHQIYSRTMLGRMFGKADKFNDVVAALKYALSSSPGQELPVELTIDFLSRLSLMDGIENKIPRDGKASLCSLPLFQHHDGKLVEASGNVCILPKLVPKSALSVIESKFTITVLENIPTLEKLYTGLGFETKGDEQFYMKYVIPSLTKFTDAQIQEYLYPYRDVVKVRTHVLDRLKGIPFVSTNESSCTRKDCSKLFHPDNELFKLMEPAGNFPNKGMYSMSNFGDFERDRWLDFFLSLGMCQCIESGDHFLKYARMLEDEDNEEKVKKVSQMLCKILLENLLSKDENVKKWSLDSNFLCKLKDIRFIAPHTGNKKFENMFPSKNSSTKRIAFNGSVTSNSFELLWTSKHVLPTYAVNYGNKSMSLDVMSELGISNKDTVQMEFVKQNLTTILTSQDYLEATGSSSCFSVKAEHRDFYNKALTEVYEFCLKHPENIESLIDVSFILVNQSKMLEQPRRCIQQVIGTINPFLNEVHIAHGKYFSVFQSLGCSENAKFSHYVDVLSQIKQVEENQGKGFLDEKLVFRATRAVTYMSRVLFDDVSTKWKQDLYLPTFKFSDLKIRMVISNECLILDDASLEERLKLFDQPILRSSSLEGISVEKDVNDKLLKYLPSSTKPKTFRASVEEVLCETCIPAQIDKKHGARIWKQRMKNPAFINGFKRLLSHEEIKEEQNYEKILKSVQIAVMENLQTELRFEGVKIEGSKIAKNVFTHLTDEQLVIYFDKEYSSEQVVSASISNAISELFGDILKTRQTITCFTKLLEMKPDQIPGFLDSQKIVNLGDHSTFRRAGKPPPLGKPIPQEHHGILNFDVSFIIEVGDYVTYDENDEGEDYVYAKIVSMNKDGSVKIQLVNDEDVDEEDGEGSRDVPRSTLYKFENKYTKGTEAEVENTQEDSSQSQEIAQFGDDGENGNARKRQRTEKPKTREETRSFEEIRDDIKKIIHDLKSKDEDEQKRVLRRLYLQWHPDKHPNKDLATEVFKFLMNEKKRLDSDFSEHFERWNEQASHNRSSRQSYERDFDDFFRHFGQQRSGSSRSRNSGSSRSRNDYTGNGFHYDNVPPRFTRENPQPAEARRWFKQAQHDFNQASEMRACPEWICYVSHQVAEKALKAAIFSKDYQGALYNEHNLCNLIREFQHADQELRNDLQELQTLVVDEDEPRYPRWSMKIPHEKFNQQKADRALVLAQRIVDNIRTNFEVE
uniref:J domain-containing protein n=2 Tax=Clytia hemisphaerica TaxID=252671 RepID=A0A7M5WQK9_9CNID